MGLQVFSNKAFLQLVKFGVSGVLSAVIEIGLLIAFVEMLHLDYLIANFLIFFIVGPVNFVLNKYWVFDRGSLSGHVQIVGFVFLALLSLGLNQLLLWAFVEFLFIDYRISKVLAIGVCVLLNFVVKKYFIFEKKKNVPLSI